MGHPLLLLHLDINKTLIAEDLAGNKSIKDVLQSIIAENTFSQWSADTHTMSYKHYVETVLCPGNKRDMEVQKSRKLQISKLFDIDSPLKEDLTKKLTQMEESMRNEYLFPSFIKMIRVLKENEIPFKIILRSFGTDLFSVSTEIQRATQEQFNTRGFFKQKQLHIVTSDEKNVVIPKIADIYDYIKTVSGHVALQDSFQEWSTDKENIKSAKQFIFNSNDRDAISIFIDDNIAADDSGNDIVCPFDIGSGEVIQPSVLLGRNIFRCDTTQAILDNNYFIKIIQDAIATSGLQFSIPQ